MTTARKIAIFHAVAVGKKIRIKFFISLDSGSKTGRHIRPIKVISDFSEALRLALGTEGSLGNIKTLKLRIIFR